MDKESVDLPQKLVLRHWGTAPDWNPGEEIQSNPEVWEGREHFEYGPDVIKIQVGDVATMAKYLDFSVQVLDGNGKVMTAMPRTKSAIHVTMKVVAEETDETSASRACVCHL